MNGNQDPVIGEDDSILGRSVTIAETNNLARPTHMGDNDGILNEEFKDPGDAYMSSNITPVKVPGLGIGKNNVTKLNEIEEELLAESPMKASETSMYS